MFGRKQRHVHRWTIVGEGYCDRVVHGLVGTDTFPRTIYALRCSECGEMTERRVEGHMKPVRPPVALTRDAD